MSSASMGSQGQSSLARSTQWCQSRSRPSVMGTLVLVRLSTRTFSTGDRSPMESIAASTFALRSTTLPRRHAPSQVRITLELASWTRSAIAWALNPPKMTECGAPMRAQASMATASSGTMPM